jgi:hypothetical protein
MKNLDRGTSLFWLVLSILVCIESVRLGIGTLRNPGMGLMAFGASALLGILSITLFLQTFLKTEEAKTESLFAGKLWTRVLLVLIALMIYAKILPLAGYLVGTFLLMSFIFWMAQFKKWWWVLVSSFLTTVITYYVFSVWLNCQFPQGLFGL